ncbi:hypothetical protein B0H16DRAFT_1465424 [Mycena metata]|uniref:Uncharacterized protein n=1 Tax=Mycena metata TaxID=1033252 RepID=A0AAD7ID12_9AGAR|nr:hypothetical protein B0H16DRAFT_1465424 [Mycena metata]
MGASLSLSRLLSRAESSAVPAGPAPSSIVQKLPNPQPKLGAFLTPEPSANTDNTVGPAPCQAVEQRTHTNLNVRSFPETSFGNQTLFGSTATGLLVIRRGAGCSRSAVSTISSAAFPANNFVAFNVFVFLNFGISRTALKSVIQRRKFH